MKIYPRSTWTSHVPREGQHADSVDDLLYFLPSSVKGIMLHFHGGAYPMLNRDPAGHFETLRHQHVAAGYSDIKYNLGVSPRAEGVWNLRGLMNKGSGSNKTSCNTNYIHVYAQLAAGEMPTDTLLKNLVEARNLVLSKYPDATEIVGHTVYDNKPVTCPGEYLQKVVGSEIWNVSPVDIGNFYIPDLSYSSGEQNVHVFDFIDLLNYLGYYRAKNSGKYGAEVQQAVREFQVDLKEGGYYNRTIDGRFGRYSQKGAGRLLKSGTLRA